MQRRMLAVAALATVAAAGPIAAAEGAASKSKVSPSFVYGGVTSSGYPVVIRLSRTGKQVVRATIGLELKCQTPGDLTLPDYFEKLPVKAGKFGVTYGPVEIPGDAATGVSKVVVSGSIKGRVNQARTQIKGTWSQQVVAYSAADPTGATVLDTCDSGAVSFTADN
jgi:hypothetical protein